MAKAALKKENIEIASNALAQKIATRSARVGVVGLGYVGLPLACEFCHAGFSVTGLDINLDTAESLRSGKSHVPSISSESLSKLVREGKFKPVADMTNISGLDVIIICVPTPLDQHRQPDLGAVLGATKAIASHLKAGQLIILESTVYPGATREAVRPVLEETGMMAGKDFYLAFSPEREDPGNERYSTKTIPKLIGGFDEISLQLGRQLYAAVIHTVIAVSSLEVAEASKLLENIYRTVNIALVNELKMVFHKMGIDIWEVIAAASSKPFGFHPFYPGPGMGGHCIPIDPFYLSWKAREFETVTRFVELAGEINWLMPTYVVQRLSEALNDRGKPVKGSRILVLGLSYKKNIPDLRESPALVILDQLTKQGAIVEYNDPLIPILPEKPSHYKEMQSQELSKETLFSYDAVLITADHSTYDWDMIVSSSRLVVDTRNATALVKKHRDRIVKA